MAITQQVPYAPANWNAAQRAMHKTTDLTEALHHATCLAGGWYQRPVTIDFQIVGDEEHYSIRPADSARPEGWQATYTIESHVGSDK